MATLAAVLRNDMYVKEVARRSHNARNARVGKGTAIHATYADEGLVPVCGAGVSDGPERRQSSLTSEMKVTCGKCIKFLAGQVELAEIEAYKMDAEMSVVRHETPTTAGVSEANDVPANAISHYAVPGEPKTLCGIDLEDAFVVVSGKSKPGHVECLNILAKHATPMDVPPTPAAPVVPATDPQQSTDVTGAKCTDTEPHPPHRIIGSFRGRCKGIPKPAAAPSVGGVVEAPPAAGEVEQFVKVLATGDRFAVAARWNAAPGVSVVSVRLPEGGFKVFGASEVRPA